MRIILALFIFLGFVRMGPAQQCDSFLIDTMTIPGTAKTVATKCLETTLKKGSTVRLIKTENGKLFIRLTVTENFYFNKVATLEIRSGSKSYWVKNATQHKVDKTHGLFVAEIYRNYVGTLKEHGITGIEFGGAYTDFTRSDASQVKQIARCMYESFDQDKNLSYE